MFGWGERGKLDSSSTGSFAQGNWFRMSFLQKTYPSGWSGSVAKQFLVGMEIYWTPGTNFFKIVILGVFIIWGDSFWNAYCGRIHPCEGIAFNLAASSSNPTREAGFQKEFKIPCKIQNTHKRHCAKLLVRIFVIRNAALRSQKRNWHLSKCKKRQFNMSYV